MLRLGRWFSPRFKSTGDFVATHFSNIGFVSCRLSWRNRGDADASAVRGVRRKVQRPSCCHLVLWSLPLPSSVRSRIGEVWDSPCGRGGVLRPTRFQRPHSEIHVCSGSSVPSSSRRALEHQALVDWVVSGLSHSWDSSETHRSGTSD